MKSQSISSFLLQKFALLTLGSVLISFTNTSPILASNLAIKSPLVAQKEGELFAQKPQAKTYFTEGVNFVQQKEISKAETSFRKAIEIDPNFMEAYANLGSVLANQNKMDEAIINFQKAVQLRPNIPFLHYVLGRAFYEQGKLEESGKELKKARDLFREQGKTDEANQIESILKQYKLE